MSLDRWLHEGFLSGKRRCVWHDTWERPQFNVHRILAGKHGVRTLYPIKKDTISLTTEICCTRFVLIMKCAVLPRDRATTQISWLWLWLSYWWPKGFYVSYFSNTCGSHVDLLWFSENESTKCPGQVNDRQRVEFISRSMTVLLDGCGGDI